MSFFSSKRKDIYFITKNFDKKIDSRCDIVLSPQFYWTKKVNLNTNFSFEVKKMAPSIFDGILPKGDFDYRVFKTNPKEFIILAYDIEHILQELKLLGIDISLVDKIYTIQSELLDKNISLKSDETHGIVSVDGIVVHLPLRFLEETPKNSIEEILQDKLSSSYIYSKNLKEMGIDKKESNLILSLLILLALVLFVHILKIEKNRNLIAKQKEKMIKRYNLPKTSFEIKSMQAEFTKIDKEQNRLREALSYIGNFTLLNKEFFNSLEYEKSHLKLSVRLNSKNRQRVFKDFVSKKFKIIKVDKNGKDFIAQVAL